MYKNLFITVDGIDGAGKSTHVDFIQRYLASKGINSITLREPGGSDFGEQIRNLLLHTEVKLHSITELLLMFASRQELLTQKIVPALNNAHSVICDRYIDASIAYQGYGREIDLVKIDKIISLLEPNLTPDLTFVFDVDLDVAQQRICSNKYKDRIERENQLFFKRVQNGYRTLAYNNPERIKLIDTNNSILDTQAKIIEYLDQLINLNKK